MPESYGARLRQRREERGIALAAIAKQTRIKEPLLEGLERDDLSQWPSGFYRRAFFRAYAGAIGLNPDAAMREFNQAHPEPPPVDVLKAMALALDRGEGNGGPGAALRGAFGSALGSLSRLRRSTPPSPMEPLPEPMHAFAGRVEEPTVDADFSSEVAHVSAELAADSTFADTSTAFVVSTEAPMVQDEAMEFVSVLVEADQSTHDAIDEVHLAASPAVVGEPADLHTAETGSAPVQAPSDDRPPWPDLDEIAKVCTDFARAGELAHMQPLLREIAQVLNARGVIVWLWDDAAGHLEPTLSHGYSERVMAQLPAVRRDADNATAAAFRCAQVRTVSDGNGGADALVVPLLSPNGCVGVLAIEMQRGCHHPKAIGAVATILAAPLAVAVASFWREVVEFPREPVAMTAEL